MPRLKLKLKGKILANTLSLLLLLSISILCIVYFQVKEFFFEQIDKELRTNITLGYELLNEEYPGDWSIQNGMLYKGSKLINDDTNFVDKFQELTGAPATIFMNDTRVSTNVKKPDGSRAIGTKISDQVAETVLKQGKDYSGKATVVNESYQSMYEPIKDVNGKTVGIWFTGIPLKYVDNQFALLYRNIFWVTLIVLLIGLLVSIIFARRISRNVQVVVSNIHAIADNDLSTECPILSHDEIGDIAKSLNVMREKLSILVQKILLSISQTEENALNLNEVSAVMVSSISGVSQSIHMIASSTSDQTTKVTSTKTEFNQFGHQLNEIAHTLQKIELDTIQMGNKASASNSQMNSVLLSLSQMNEMFLGFINRVSELSEQVKSINQITSVLKEISGQTNLLALNAGIEAARAGEAGKGFAVVAEEVRKLADQSQDSAKNITELVNGVSMETHELKTVSQSVQIELTNQLQAIGETIQAFKGMVGQVNQIVPEVQMITASTNEITEQKDELFNNFEIVSNLSEEIAASTESIASSSEGVKVSSGEIVSVTAKMSTMAGVMKDLVSQFKI